MLQRFLVTMLFMLYYEVEIINHYVQDQLEISLCQKFPILILSLKLNTIKHNNFYSNKRGVFKKKYGSKDGKSGTTPTRIPNGVRFDK